MVTETTNKTSKNKIIVGITGTILAGKGTVVDILKFKGFKHVSIRDLIREELARQNMPLSRANMQDMGNLMRKKHGLEYWIKIALEKYANDNTPLIIESLRNPAEITYLKNNSKFFLIGMDAPFEIRLERVKKRDADLDRKDQDTFEFDDARDKGFNEPLNGQQVGMCLVQADFLIYNDEEFTDLKSSKIYKEVMEIYGKVTGNKP
jgi:dephospho-CoA kinase